MEIASMESTTRLGQTDMILLKKGILISVLKAKL